MRALVLAVLLSLGLTAAAFGLVPRLGAPDLAPALVGPAVPEITGPWAAYVAPVAACPGGDDAAAPPADQQRTMLCLVNYARARRGVPPVAPAVPLATAAALKAQEIVRCGRFDHDPCGHGADAVFDASRYKAGVTRWGTGENLALASARIATPRGILKGWLESDGHRENLFREDWREQGVALVTGATIDGEPDLHIWVSDFGYRER